ncbi:FHA domain-containing protein [Nocardioides sp. KR10-350]|uniref:FHA domain-containing protein n=1 Tax=Nocardioides cheoyonin TaxID=3156615 RepID=UPI0032B39762
MVVLLPRDQTILLGRHAPDPAIRGALAPYDQVSRRHAELLITGTAARIRDLGSANGTFVNDIPVSPETTIPIGEGVRLRFGKELELALIAGGLS